MDNIISVQKKRDNGAGVVHEIELEGKRGPTDVGDKDVSEDDVSSCDNEFHRCEAPDGGWRAWFVVFGAFCGFFATQGYGYAWGVFYNYYNTEVYPGNMTALSWIGSLWYCLCNVTGPIYFWMGSKFDDRYTVGVACILSAASMMFASITNSVWQLYITQGIMSGLAASLVWFSCMRGPQEWFSKRRGLAVGLTMSASGCGGLVFSNMVDACFKTIGYRWALRVLGFVQLVLCAIAAISCKRLNPLTSQENTKKMKHVPFIDFTVMKNKKFLILFTIHFIGNFAFYIPSGFVPSYANYLGLDSWIGANINGIMSGCMFVGKITVGFTSDYIGRFNAAVICALMACIAHLAVWLPATSAGPMWAFAVIYGFFGGGYISMITAIITECVGVENIDSGTGWAFFAWCFGGLFGQPVASSIVDRGAVPDYKGAIIYAGVILFAGACLSWSLRVVQGGWKLIKKV